MTPPTWVIVHGHFYQPPRENPWTGAIELQESAAPYHDWNEQVAAECYTPNARSRVLDHLGRVLDVVNNYEHISFNFGPTLLGYLEEHLPATYERILAADERSHERRGLGNAMAQVYNHVIMPLASRSDRRTQIRWGVADFESRFGRRPQGMWLAECAVCDAVMDELAQAGIAFVILAPSQAERIRADGEQAWRDVSGGDIPTHRPYVCRTPHGNVSVLFYHEGVSRAVAFEHLLRNASTFADRIVRAAAEAPLAGGEEDRLVLVATDGESYGHHEAMGDMCLAYLATRELPGRHIAMTNPAAYLADHPVRFEVRLKPGQRGLGTAWSCAHGVGRWMEDCGCTTGGPPSWNQAWRDPLRAAFDRLRERMDPLFEREGRKYLADPWAARDDYIHVLLGRPVGAANLFFEKHAEHELSDVERVQVYRLLEMQRYGMLMYTSCGWFFADLAGIEAVQNLRYFARAAQLGELIAGEPLAAEASEELARAQSNLASAGSGLDLLAKQVQPSALSPRKVAAHQAIRALLDGQAAGERLYGFRIQVHAEQRESRAGTDAFCGRLTVQAQRSGEGGTFDVVVLAGSALKLKSFVRAYDPQLGPLAVEALLDMVESLGFEGAGERLAARFDEGLDLPDMLPELRLQAMTTRIKPVLRELNDAFDTLYHRHESLLRSLQSLGVGLPEALIAAVGYAVSRRFDQQVERGLSEGDLSAAREQSEMAETLGVPLRRFGAGRRIGRYLAERLQKIFDDPRPADMVAMKALLDAARAMRLEVDEASLQDRVFEALDPVLDLLLKPARPGGPWPGAARAWVDLAAYLNLNVEAARRRLEEVKP